MSKDAHSDSNAVSRIFVLRFSRILINIKGAKPNGVATNHRPSLRKMFEDSDLSEQKFADSVAANIELARRSTRGTHIGRPRARELSERFFREVEYFPFADANEHFRFAMADPSDMDALRAAELALEVETEVVIASFDDMASALDARLARAQTGHSAAGLPIEGDSLENLRDLVSGASIVRALHEIIEKAVALRASGIRNEPLRLGIVLRVQVAGSLRPVAAPAAPSQALTSRLKILAGLDIAERRLPQQGGERLRVGRTDIDVRVATLPTHLGRTAVIQLLPRDRGMLAIDELGLRPPEEPGIRRALGFSNSLIFVTGPTGSGKTTTLATLLTALNFPAVKILTVEDLIEYKLAGIVLAQVKGEIGLTFAATVHAFVRLSPDIIMVGDVRDAETADIAVDAALTGHLVLATLHAEPAAGAVPQLINLGIKPFLLIKLTLRLVVALRLVGFCATDARLGGGQRTRILSAIRGLS